jgi:invasion protein IalB
MRYRTTQTIAASALIAIVLLPAFWSIALAEEAGAGDQPASVKKPAETEFAPRGQRETRDIQYGDWRKVCFQTPGTKMVCRTSISGTWETGQSAVRADLIERDGDSAARLQLFLPVGLYLPAAVKLSVDQGTQYRIPYVWCLTNTCIAAEVADPRLVEDMEKGKTLRIEMVDANLLTIGTAVPLDHFATVRKGAPSESFEHEIDE